MLEVTSPLLMFSTFPHDFCCGLLTCTLQPGHENDFVDVRISRLTVLQFQLLYDLVDTLLDSQETLASDPEYTFVILHPTTVRILQCNLAPSYSSQSLQRE
jgi:hypothetical protein